MAINEYAGFGAKRLVFVGAGLQYFDTEERREEIRSLGREASPLTTFNPEHERELDEMDAADLRAAGPPISSDCFDWKHLYAVLSGAEAHRPEAIREFLAIDAHVDCCTRCASFAKRTVVMTYNELLSDERIGRVAETAMARARMRHARKNGTPME